MMQMLLAKISSLEARLAEKEAPSTPPPKRSRRDSPSNRTSFSGRSSMPSTNATDAPSESEDEDEHAGDDTNVVSPDGSIDTCMQLVN